MTHKTKIFSIAATALLLLIFAGTYYIYNKVFTPAFDISSPTRIYIDTNDNIDSVRQKVILTLHPRSINTFDMLASHEGYDKAIQTGCYQFSPTDNLRTAIRKLKHGWQTPVRIVVPSVRTIDRMAQSLAKQLMLEEEDLTTLFSDKSFIDSLGFTTATLPAFFIPNTYEVYWNITPARLADRFQKEYHTYWTKERQSKATAQGLTPIEVATLASIVDEETAVNAEKPIVAGLYLNRLNCGMLLQADPTVKFSTGDPTLRRILNKHLTIDSPYNTYIYKGLPPGPIRIPSMSALEAVLNPARHNHLYMCAKEDFSGTHNFATTLSQHNANARRYQQALNRRGIK